MPGGGMPGGGRAMPGGGMPGGGMPGGAIPGGAIPGGAIPGSAIPGGAIPGGAIPGGAIPGGTIPGGAIPGGTIPGGIIPGGGMPGGGRMTGAPAICGRGSIVPGAGPPTPRAGPAKPAGAAVGAATGSPRPAALPMPGPVLATFWTTCSAGGGPSICIATTSSPRSNTKPSTRRSSRCGLKGIEMHHVCNPKADTSSLCPFFGGRRRNSSQSPSTKFMCLSKAINLGD